MAEEPASPSPEAGAGDEPPLDAAPTSSSPEQASDAEAPIDAQGALAEMEALAAAAGVASPPSPRGEGEPGPPPAGLPEGQRPPSPYDHLLRIRGDVDQTRAIAIFLGGLVALLLVWWGLTVGDPHLVQQTGTIGDDGTLALAEPISGSEVWADGFTRLDGDAAPSPREFKVTSAALVFHPDAKGEEVTYGYTVGREPVVSHFLLPQPGEVLRAVVHNLTGHSFELTCPNRECPSRQAPGGGKLALSSGDGERLQEFRTADDGRPAPEVKCPTCGAALAGEVVIGRAPYRFRNGLLSTVKRTAIGFCIAVAICLPLGVLAGAFPPVKRFVSPLEIAGGYTPPVALLPLAVALYGVAKNSDLLGSVWAAEVARTSFLVVVIAFWLYPLITKEVESVDEVFINTAYTLGATRGQAVLRVLVPISMAAVWEHLRATYAIGWASIILAEGYAVGREEGETGIGFFMVDMQRRHLMENYFAAVLAIIATGIVVDYAFKLLGRWLFPYQETT